MAKKGEQVTEDARLTDEECDFIIQRLCWVLRDAVNPQEFYRGTGRGAVFEPPDREAARAWVRAFVRVEA